MVSLDCLLLMFFIVCQAALVRPHGITLPITSLSYKSSPTNPKCLSSTEKSEISPPSNNGITSVDYINTPSGIKPAPQESPPRLVTPGLSTNLPLKTVSVSSVLPQSNVVNTDLQVIDIPVEKNNFKPNIATTQVFSPQNNLCNVNVPKDDILNDYLPKASPIVLTPNNIVNNKDINAINLKSSPPIMVKAVPYDTCKISNGNIQPIYIDCSKQSCIPPSAASINPEIIKVKDLRLIHGRQVAQNVAAIENIFRETKEVLVPNVPLTPDKCKTTDSLDKINCPQQSTDGMKYVNLETPVVINNVVFPYTNQMLNYNTLDKKIQLKQNPVYANNELDVLVTPKVSMVNNNVAVIPSNIQSSEYQNRNNIIYNEPVLETFSYIQPDKVPVLSQLPNVCNSKVNALSESPSSTLPIISVTETPCDNKLFVSNVSPNSLQNYLAPVCGDPNYNNIATLNVPRSSTSVSSVPFSQPYSSQMPTLLQLPNTNKSPEIIFSPPALPPPSIPPNIVFMKTPDLSYSQLIDNRFPASAFNTEINGICSNELQNNFKILPNNLHSFNYPVLNVDTNIVPMIHSNCISSNILPSTSISLPSSAEMPIYSQSAEYITPKMTSSSSPTNIIYPNQKSISLPDPYTSTLSDTLNSLVSTLTSSLLSAFYDMSANTEKEIVFDVPTLPDTVTDLPSSVFCESSFSFSMPLYIPNPPPLESPAFLPTPKIKLPYKCIEKVSKRKSGLKPPKAYISSILINILPPKEVSNDIVIIV